MQIIQSDKCRKWFPFVLFFLLALPILFREFGSGDELWNYNFAINISNGKLPYSDFSIVQTPLSAYFSALFLLIFGNSLISFRLAGIVLIAITFALMHSVCTTLTGQRWVSWIACTFTYVLVYHIWIYNYNYLILFVVMLIIYLMLKEKPLCNRFVAFLYGLLPLIKQSTGALLLLLFWSFLFVDLVKKQQRKKYLLVDILISITPGVLFLVFLLLTRSFTEFWEYAIDGVKTFTHRTYIWEYVLSTLVAFMVTLFIAFTMIFSLITVFRNGNESKSTQIRILLIAVFAGVVSYPLTDHYHMMVALVPYVICFLMCFRYKEHSSLQKSICMSVAALILIASSVNVVYEVRNLKLCELNHYRGIPIAENVECNIKLVDEFILDEEEKGKKVIIADECAAACMIPLDRYTKNFDMLLIGNLGANTVRDLVSENENVIYLVTKDDATLGYQAHYELIKFIKENYTKVGEVAGLDAYEKQN